MGKSNRRDGKKQSKIDSYFKQKGKRAKDENAIITYQKIDSTTIDFKLLNSKKRYLSMVSLANEAEDCEHFICFGQEPNTSGFNLNGLNRKHVSITANVESPRAYLYTSKNIHTWPLHEYSNRDVTSAIMDTHDPRFGRVMLISLYWDINDREEPNICNNAVRFANDQGYTVIIGADTNAHSVLFGGKETNTRGRRFEEFLARNNLDIANKGNRNTFVGEQGHSIIDVVAISTDFRDNIKKWRVTDKEVHSDHRLIEFNIDVVKQETIYKTDIHDGNDKDFQLKMEERAENIMAKYKNNTNTIRDLEHLTDDFTTCITSITKETYKTKEMKISPRVNLWRNENIRRQSEVNAKARRFYKNMECPERKVLWKKQEKILSDMKKGAIKDFKRGKIEKVVTQKDLAKLHKWSQNGRHTEIGLIKNINEKLASTPEESLTNLCEQHFPGSKKLNGEDVGNYINNMHDKIGHIGNNTYDWITVDRIKRAVNMFDNDKSPGTDNIQPELLQRLGTKSLEVIKLIFERMITAGYTPTKWRESKIIFLAKPGKEDYAKAKAFRPISLTSFVFKTMERLCFFRAYETALSDKPMHVQQHAYRAGYSTESAISKVIDTIEKGLLKKSYTLASFIDISSAFDKLDPHRAINALEKRGFEDEITKWYKNYLTRRYATVEIKGVKTERLVSTGCPQGGVLSTMLWCVAFDDLIELFDNSDITCVGYADDGALLTVGNNLPQMYKNMNKALDLCQGWARKYGLNVSAEKTNYMLCTNKRRTSYKIPKEGIKLNNIQIEKETSVRYLGLIIDHKLNGNENLTEKINALKRQIFGMKNYIGKTWGPSPYMTKYAYTNILRPKITYACFTYAHRLTQGQKKRLWSLQRLATNMYGSFRQKAPGDATEMVTDTVPLDLKMLKETAKSNLRLKSHYTMDWDRRSGGERVGHIKAMQLQEDEIGLPDVDRDCIPKELELEQHYHMNTKSLNEGANLMTGTRCYTDGSKTHRGVGAGYVILDDNDEVIKAANTGLPAQANIFQAELKAIEGASRYINNSDITTDIDIMTDSQAAYKALANYNTVCTSVKRTKEALNELGKQRKVTIHWIKAHADHHGNELADKEAKDGTKKIVLEPVPMGKAEIDNKIDEYVYKLWDERWNSNPERCKHTKKFFKHPNPKISKEVMKLSRYELSIFVRYVTGHAHLRKHNSKMYNNIKNTGCRHCSMEGFSKDETAIHLIADCETFAKTRANIFNQYFMDEESPDWGGNVRGLVALIKAVDLESKEDVQT